MQAYALFDFMWHYALPVLIFAYCYSRILHTIRRQNKVVSGHVGRSHDVAVATTSRDQNPGQVQQQATGAPPGGKVSQAELNVLKTMITLIVCFIACWTPFSLASGVLSLTVGCLFLQLYIRALEN